ncbi:MAG: hypothetical protein RDV41_11690 [Planctomycetota bacterium]|nr:hypothetical protein [Planctomycetota bacterium]
MVAKKLVSILVCLATFLAATLVCAQSGGKRPEEPKPDIAKAAKEMRAAKGFVFNAKSALEAPGMPAEAGQNAVTLDGTAVNPALVHATSGDGPEIASTSKTSLVKQQGSDKWTAPASSDSRTFAMLELARFAFHAMQEIERLARSAKKLDDEKIGEADCWKLECPADKEYVKKTVQRIIKGVGDSPVPLDASMVDFAKSTSVFNIWISKDASLPLKLARNTTVAIRTPMGSGTVKEVSSVEVEYPTEVEVTLPQDVLKKLGPNK